MRRYDRLREIRRLDPDKDCETVYRLLAAYEFPWDFTKALELALYRTYAVPSIGRLLAETAELTERSQKRYDDTSLLLDAAMEHGHSSERGRTAIRRINQMHRAYDISNDDMRYVLSTFVVTPKRWLDDYGWRSLTAHEAAACAAYYQRLGRNMGIRDIPGDYPAFEDCLDRYEKEHFAYDTSGRAVSDATLALMASWYPRPLAPLVKAGALALLDDSLIEAFRYRPPNPTVRRAVRGAVRLRGRAVRLLPPRTRPHFARQNRQIKGYPGYPDGYDLAELGTFPAGCPRPHGRGQHP
ncbi:oxygenase MpaB family protein [Streptomyces alkaliterrae]|uniref:DUF2236 domain-containing protein n=1 Tax=Streptomyces alkaliterrae TaxID=2213162 RepID=A0A5P0YTS5_9ACTN|nr:oxygenase MpaB family protein [Streptomyces alkaliterrae]MBB1258870.1 DUF2236 domain-containing protein [Streptomyces alkaliterrae]MQS03320.1 DUF2236 domain-containing protein [Streptomyces alkaliterrae]